MKVVEFAEVRFLGPIPTFLRHSKFADCLGPPVLIFFGGSVSSVCIVEVDVDVDGPALLSPSCEDSK